MTMDPYSPCPCGSGKKIKWCRPKTLAQVPRIVGMIENRQSDMALTALDRLAAEEDAPECLRMFIDVLKAQALAIGNRMEESIAAIEQAEEKYPTFGLPNEMMGDMVLATENPLEALDSFREALAHYPPEASTHRAATLYKIGECQMLLGRPLAAWASWKQAIPLHPQRTGPAQAIQEAIKDHPLLPNQIRHGLGLKAPDEFALFNPDRGERWEAAMAAADPLHVDDLVSLFEELTQDDPQDAAAWYNLGVSLAWSGDSVRAIEAFEQYVKLEPDLEAAASAWEIAEILRLAADASEISDNLQHVALYRIVDRETIAKTLEGSRRVLIETGARVPIVFWLDRDHDPDEAGIPILGGPPRRLAQIVHLGEYLQLSAPSADSLIAARRDFESTLGAAIALERDLTVPRQLESLDVEPLMIVRRPGQSDEERAKDLAESAREFFEEIWLRRPLKSLAGLAPLDAAQSQEYRKRLEGVIRVRERNFEQMNVGYNFDRLRHKLGLPTSAPPEAKPTDVAGYSAADLAAIGQPADLSDDDLLAAYRAACGLDSDEMALRFAREAIGRPSFAHRPELDAMAKRVVQSEIDAGRYAEARDRIEELRRRFPSPFLDGLLARTLLAEGKPAEAIAVFRRQIDADPADVDLVAAAAESLLRAGQYASALELSELGLARADEHRRRDLKDQFREFAAEAKRRSGS